MMLFDDFERKDLDTASYSESSFGYLNRSARPLFNENRKILEDWFTRYPSPHQNELRSQFRSNNNFQFQGAFFELLLHELLLKLGGTISIHPQIENTQKSPDFLVQFLDTPEQDFILEATVVSFQSSAEVAAEARLNNIYDVLNKHVDGSDFFIDVKIDKYPKTPPPARRIANFLNEKLKGINPDTIRELYEQRYDRVPQWIFSHNNWSIIFRPIPKKTSARGNTSARPLGMFSGGLKWLNHRGMLRDAILGKANSYGNLMKPFVIAVNALGPIDTEDVMDALFGDEQVSYYLSQDNPGEIVDRTISREPNGAWMIHSGPRNKRVSVVLIFKHLLPWNIANTGLRLYHNPWARKTYNSVLTRFPQAIPDKTNNKIDMVDGISLGEVLEISRVDF